MTISPRSSHIDFGDTLEERKIGALQPGVYAARLREQRVLVFLDEVSNDSEDCILVIFDDCTSDDCVFRSELNDITPITLKVVPR